MYNTSTADGISVNEMKTNLLLCLILALTANVLTAQQKPLKPLTTKLNESNMTGFSQRIPSKEPLNDYAFNLPESASYEVQQAFNNLQHGDREACKKVFEQHAANDWVAACGLAVYYVTAQNNAKAIEVLSSAAERFPENETVLFRLGELYYRDKDFVKAEQQYIGVININVDNADAWYKLGMLYLSVESLRNFAEYSFTRVMHLNHDDMHAPFELARLQSREADTDQALQSLGIALQKGFANRKLLSEDKDLVNLRATEGYAQMLKLRFGS